MKALLPVAAFLLVLAAGAGIVRQGNAMPPRVASHFDAAGHPDGWMESRREVRLFLGSALGTALFVAAVGYAIRFLPPSMLNVPHAAHWRAPEHFPKACRFLFEACLALGAFLALWMAALHGLIAVANRHVPAALDGRGMTVLLALFFAGTAAWIAWIVLHFSKPR